MTKTIKTIKPVRTAKAPRVIATPTASARTAPKTSSSRKTVTAPPPPITCRPWRRVRWTRSMPCDGS